VEDLNDSFKKFEPKLNFKGNAGPEETEFKAEFRFKSIKDFDPENLQKRQEIKTEDGETKYLRNDIRGSEVEHRPAVPAEGPVEAADGAARVV